MQVVLTQLTYLWGKFLSMDEIMLLTRINRESRYLSIDGELVVELFRDKKIKIKNILNSVEMLHWLEDKDYKVNINTLNVAVNMDVLENLFDRGIEPNYDTLYSATYYGHLEKIKWLVETYNFWVSRYNGEELCSVAASNGHLGVLKWYHEKDYYWNSDVLSNAALNGHLEVLKWALENRCPWDEWNDQVCLNAASEGHIEILKWVLEQGCGWNGYACTLAAQNGHLEIIKFAHERKYHYNIDDVYKYAKQKNNIEMLKWIEEIRR